MVFWDARKTIKYVRVTASPPWFVVWQLFQLWQYVTQKSDNVAANLWSMTRGGYYHIIMYTHPVNKPYTLQMKCPKHLRNVQDGKFLILWSLFGVLHVFVSSLIWPPPQTRTQTRPRKHAPVGYRRGRWGASPRRGSGGPGAAHPPSAAGSAAAAPRCGRRGAAPETRGRMGACMRMNACKIRFNAFPWDLCSILGSCVQHRKQELIYNTCTHILYVYNMCIWIHICINQEHVGTCK